MTFVINRNSLKLDESTYKNDSFLYYQLVCVEKQLQNNEIISMELACILIEPISD